MCHSLRAETLLEQTPALPLGPWDRSQLFLKVPGTHSSSSPEVPGTDPGSSPEVPGTDPGSPPSSQRHAGAALLTMGVWDAGENSREDQGAHEGGP